LRNFAAIPRQKALSILLSRHNRHKLQPGKFLLGIRKKIYSEGRETLELREAVASLSLEVSEAKLEKVLSNLS